MDRGDEDRPESDGSDETDAGEDGDGDSDDDEREQEQERERKRKPGSDLDVDIEDGAGCVEIWERLSESRSEDES